MFKKSKLSFRSKKPLKCALIGILAGKGLAGLIQYNVNCVIQYIFGCQSLCHLNL